MRKNIAYMPFFLMRIKIIRLKEKIILSRLKNEMTKTGKTFPNLFSKHHKTYFFLYLNLSSLSKRTVRK